jgi:hypothetical protein
MCSDGRHSRETFGWLIEKRGDQLGGKLLARFICCVFDLSAAPLCHHPDKQVIRFTLTDQAIGVARGESGREVLLPQSSPPLELPFFFHNNNAFRSRGCIGTVDWIPACTFELRAVPSQSKGWDGYLKRWEEQVRCWSPFAP